MTNADVLSAAELKTIGILSSVFCQIVSVLGTFSGNARVANRIRRKTHDENPDPNFLDSSIRLGSIWPGIHSSGCK